MAARAIGRYPRAATARTARHSRRHCPYIAGERTRAVIVVAPRRACLALVSAHALTRCEAMATQTNLLVATIPAAGALCCAHTANCLAAARTSPVPTLPSASAPRRASTEAFWSSSPLAYVCLSLHPSSRPDLDRRSVTNLDSERKPKSLRHLEPMTRALKPSEPEFVRNGAVRRTRQNGPISDRSQNWTVLERAPHGTIPDEFGF